jgi:hypothetical protein
MLSAVPAAYWDRKFMSPAAFVAAAGDVLVALVGRRIRNLDCRIARIWVPGARRNGNGRKNRQREHG